MRPQRRTTGGASAQDITTGLLLHYALDDGSGSTFSDSSGNGYDGSLIGSAGSWVTGKVGSGAYDVNSVATIRAPANAPLHLHASVTSSTIACWVKPSSLPAGRMGVMTKISNNVAYRLLEIINGYPRWLTYTGGGIITSSLQLTVGVWAHLAVVVDISIPKTSLKVNGVERASMAAVGGSDAASAPWDVSGTSNGNAARFNGPIDDVRIYDRALTDDQVNALVDL